MLLLFEGYMVIFKVSFIILFFSLFRLTFLLETALVTIIALNYLFYLDFQIYQYEAQQLCGVFFFCLVIPNVKCQSLFFLTLICQAHLFLKYLLVLLIKYIVHCFYFIKSFHMSLGLLGFLIRIYENIVHIFLSSIPCFTVNVSKEEKSFNQTFGISHSF